MISLAEPYCKARAITVRALKVLSRDGGSLGSLSFHRAEVRLDRGHLGRIIVKEAVVFVRRDDRLPLLVIERDVHHCLGSRTSGRSGPREFIIIDDFGLTRLSDCVSIQVSVADEDWLLSHLSLIHI